MAWDFGKSKSSANDSANISYEFPDTVQSRLDSRASSMGISSEDLLTLLIEVGLSNKEDLRKTYLLSEADKIEERYKEGTTLPIGDAELYFDDVKVLPVIDENENTFEIHITFYLAGNKIASKIERPLSKIL